jgi:hypothetical protein
MAMSMLLGLSLLVGSFTTAEQSRPPAPAPVVAARAAWLAGCWVSFGKGGPTGVHEAWTIASNDLMTGRSSSGSPGLLADYVFMRIESVPGSGVALVRQRAAQRPERFAMELGTPASELTFSAGAPGPARKISYRRGAKEDEITVKTAADGSAAVEIQMKRTGCRQSP